MSTIRREQLRSPLSASYALTASFAENVNVTINTSSLVTTSSFNAYTASINNFTSSINAFTASYNTGSFTGSFTGSLFGTSSWAVSASQAVSSSYYKETDPVFTAVSGTFVTTSSFNAFTSSINSFTSSYNTGSFSGSFTGSLQGTSSWASNALLAVSSSNYQETDPVFVAKSASLATTGSNIFIGNQTITGSLTVTSNLTVLGSASIQYISESTLNIGTNLITVNTNTPSVRFGGLAVIDSGSSPLTSASFLYDSVQDEFIFVHRGNGINITSSHFVLGPETYNDLGNETYLTVNRIPKGKGNEHLNDSNISDNGSLVTINSNTRITGSTIITGSLIVADSPSIPSINSSLKELYDGSGILSIAWGSRKLNDNAGSIITDYSNPIITQHFVYSNNTHTSAKLEDFSSTFNYAGVILYEVPINASLYELVSLSGGTWSTTQHWKNTATVKLGIVVIDNGNGTGDVLLEGDIVVNSDDNSEGPYVTGVTTTGEPIYIADSFIAGNGQMSETAPDNEYLRTLGHLYYNNVNTNSSLYIMRFNPSNDYYRLV
jgi:hypothetical protein